MSAADPQGSVVIITGSSRGIGLETARLYLHHGHRVVLNGRDPQRLTKAQAQLDPDGARTLVVAGDVTDSADVRRLVEATVERWGRIDVLICNAGLMMRGPFSELSAAVAERIMRVNVLGVTLPIVQALPEITKQGGSIEIISSLAGIRGMPHISLYCASKMALTAIAESLWVELTGTGVHVGILYVGITENDPEKTLLSADGRDIKVKRSSHSTQQQVAAAVHRQVSRRKRRVVMTPAGKALAFLQWLMPGVLTAIIARAQKTSTQMAS